MRPLTAAEVADRRRERAEILGRLAQMAPLKRRLRAIDEEILSGFFRPPPGVADDQMSHHDRQVHAPGARARPRSPAAGGAPGEGFWGDSGGEGRLGLPLRRVAGCNARAIFGCECEESDLNPHGFTRWNLNAANLAVSAGFVGPRYGKRGQKTGGPGG